MSCNASLFLASELAHIASGDRFRMRGLLDPDIDQIRSTARRIRLPTIYQAAELYTRDGILWAVRRVGVYDPAGPDPAPTANSRDGQRVVTHRKLPPHLADLADLVDQAWRFCQD